MMKLVQNWPKIDIDFKKVCEKCMRKWERVCQSMLMQTLIDTQHEVVGPELAKIAQ